MLLVVGSWVWVLDLITSCIDLGRLTLRECCTTNVVFCEVAFLEYRNSVCSMPLSVSSVTHGCLTAICRQYYKLAGRTREDHLQASTVMVYRCLHGQHVSTSPTISLQPLTSLPGFVSIPWIDNSLSYSLSIRRVQPTGFPYCWPVWRCITRYLTNSDIHHMDSSLGQPCSVSINVTNALEVFFYRICTYIFIFYLLSYLQYNCEGQSIDTPLCIESFEVSFCVHNNVILT